MADEPSPAEPYPEAVAALRREATNAALLHGAPDAITRRLIEAAIAAAKAARPGPR